MAKQISPAAIHALKEALSTVYWYKNDLKKFLILTLGDTPVLNRFNWEDSKRNIVGSLIDFLFHGGDHYQNILIKLMADVATIDDFTHLEHLDAGREKAEAAKSAVKALRVYTEAHQDVLNEQEAIARRRQLTYEKRLANERGIGCLGVSQIQVLLTH